MSTPRSHLLSLAPEIVEHIIKQVSEKNDLSNARLVCKTLDRYAVEELFKDVFVSPSKKHMSAWNSISQDDIQRMPHHSIVQTRSYIEGDGDDYDFYREDEVEIGEEFEAAVAALARFPNLVSLEIAFTPQCVGKYSRDSVMEEVCDREK